MAEDPADGQSFGSSRAGFLANALVEHALLPLSDQGPQRFLSLLEAQFVAHGATLSAPYLQSATRDPFGSANIRPHPDDDQALFGGRPSPHIPDQLALASARIAHALNASAIWHGDTCTWLAPTLAESCWPTLPYEVLDADLYDGVSGVAIFLACAWQHFGRPDFARSARGAARYAIAAMKAARENNAIGASAGMFAGWPGVCMAAGMVGKTLGDPALLAQAVGDACRLAVEAAPTAEKIDLIDGLYGRIVALSQLSSLSPGTALQACIQEDLQRLAVLESMATGADAIADGDDFGLAHGRHGHLRALIAARAAVRPPEMLAPRVEAERKRADCARRTRLSLAGSAARSTSWCRGAAGYVAVASSDRHARNYPSVAESRVQIARALLARLQDGPGDLGLCHGLAGEASVLSASRPTGLAAGADGICDEAVLAVTGTVLDLLMPSGALNLLGRFAHPSLMQGLSGIGLFLLQQLKGEPGPLSIILGTPAGSYRHSQARSSTSPAGHIQLSATAR
jgi:lantibiotic modifying enzyme